MRVTPLPLCSLDALITELFSRFDHAVFIGQTTHATHLDKEIIRAAGNRRVCQGLCAGASSAIDRMHQDNARVVEEDEG